MKWKNRLRALICNNSLFFFFFSLFFFWSIECIAGQANLLKSSILVVGAGGLGSPALLYLAACGVGKL